MIALKKILQLLTPGEKRRGALLVGMLIIMALFETAGVASIMPFLAVLADPSVVQNNPFLYRAYIISGAPRKETFLLYLAIVVLLVVTVGALFRVLSQFAVNRYVQMRRHSVSRRLLSAYLRQPYTFFVQRHSGDLAKSILSEVDALVLAVFRPGFDVLAYLVVAIAVITLLIIVDPVLAGVIGFVIGGLYVLVYLAVAGVLSRIGQERTAANEQRFKAAAEAISAIKIIKLLGKEEAYLKRFSPPSERFARHWATNATLAQVPKYVIEAIGIGGIVILAITLMIRGQPLSEALPVMGLYAFAGYKLLPAAQHIYAGLANLRFGAAAVATVHQDLIARSSTMELLSDRCEPLAPRECIELSNITYRYPGADSNAIDGISIRIPVGKAIAFVGGTGSGKTTLVDVLMGLLEPSGGSLRVDGLEIGAETRRAWRRCIGYVPQEVVLSDATIPENIALGEDNAAIDIEKVLQCMREAQLIDYEPADIRDRMFESVGERGVRLSGGQRQRIGIARALYRSPSVLVFDEATSALDSTTERAVIESIRRLAGRRTTVMIAHRLETVKFCDVIYVLKAGRVIEAGHYDELVARNGSFKQLLIGAGQ